MALKNLALRPGRSVKTTSIVLAAALLALSSSAQALEVTPQPVSNYSTFFPQGTACLDHNDVNLNLQERAKAAITKRLLTPEALAAGVEVYITGSEENKFGNVSVLYWQPKGSCVLWYETISVVEYATRLGLTPFGISPFYKKDGN